MSRIILKRIVAHVAICFGVYAMSDVDQAAAARRQQSSGPSDDLAPAPLVGAIGGPADLLAAGAVYGAYGAMRRFKKISWPARGRGKKRGACPLGCSAI
jgi:hypothetical protein